MEFKNNLEKLMHEKDITAAELSRVSKVGEVSIHYYLNGKQEPTAATINKLANALGISSDDLLQTKFSDNNFAIDPAARQLLEERKVLASKSSKATLDQLKQINKIIDALIGEKDYDD